MKAGLVLVVVADVTIIAVALGTVLTKKAPIVPVAIVSMVGGVIFSYLVLRNTTELTPPENPATTGGGQGPRAGLVKLAFLLAGVGGMLMVIGGVIHFVAGVAGGALRAVVAIGFGFYFFNLYLRNR